MIYELIMLRNSILFGVVISIWMAASNTADASNITIVIDNKISVSEDAVEITLEVRNEGDEDSLVVYPFVRIGDIEKRFKQVPYIAFEGASRWAERFSLEEIGWEEKGIYPLYLWIHYHDENMYPFSVVQIYPVNYGNVSMRQVLNGKLTASTLERRSKLSFYLVNSGISELEGRFELYLPNELSVLGDKEKPFKLESGEMQEWEYEIQNDAALPNSRYQLQVVAHYDLESIPTVQIFTDEIRIVQAKPDKWNKQVVGGIIFIFFLFLLTGWMEIRRSTEAT